MMKQVLALAAVVAVSSGAMANSSQGSSAGGVGLSEGSSKALSTPSNASIKLSFTGAKDLQDAGQRLQNQGTAQFRRAPLINKMVGSSGWVMGLSVQSVGSVSQGSTRVLEVVTNVIGDSSKVVVLHVAKPAAAAGDRVAAGVSTSTSSFLQKGANIAVGVSRGAGSSVKVLVEDMRDAAVAGSQSNVVKSSKIIVSSPIHSSEAFTSELVKGFRK